MATHDVSETTATHSSNNFPEAHRTTPELSELAKQTFTRAANSTGTLASYESDYRVFKAWFFQTNSQPPVTDIHIINFLVDQYNGVLSKYDKKKGKLSNGGCVSPFTLDRRRWAILKLLARDGERLNEEQRENVSKAVQQLKMSSDQKKPLRKRGQAYPLRWSDIEAMVLSPLMRSKPKFVKLRDSALLALSAVTGARESELLGTFGMRIKDIDIYDNYIDYRRVVLKNGSRDHSFKGKISMSTSSKICAVHIIRKYIEFLTKDKSVTGETKIFLRSNRRGEVYKKEGVPQTLGATTFDNILRDYALSSDIDFSTAGLISGHSVRMGLVVGQVEGGMSYESISKITGQSITTVERYAKQAQVAAFSGE
ncbi:tyrosine-type recombinase/integrase [Marinomonas algicola]|uniref:tyrosine-type recombinase/integrase n=1 Tax=Marinomonas algicola TaxID=2773454 RepID=UPI001748F6B0|nr:hypothetical protein [Marinomonas algicola]